MLGLFMKEQAIMDGLEARRQRKGRKVTGGQTMEPFQATTRPLAIAMGSETAASRFEQGTKMI